MTYSIIYSLLGAIAGFLFGLDVCYKPREKGSFVRILVIVLSSLIPLLGGLFFDNKIADLAKGYIIYFYLGFVALIIITLLGFYFFSYIPLIKKISINDNTKRFTFLDMFRGYNEFKTIYDTEYKTLKDSLKLQKKEYSNIVLNLRADFMKFIHDINKSETFYELGLDEFLTGVINEFIESFFGHYNARITIREYDDSSGSMVTKLTTRRDKIPGPVPLDKPNLISKSSELDVPLIYSENKKFHYNTQNNSIEKREYVDYVTYCLLEDFNTGIPLYSLSLDVKDETAVYRMKALVYSLGFDILCWTIIKKFIHETS